MRQAFAPLTLALMALLSGAPSWAGVGSGTLTVEITLGTGLAAPLPGTTVAAPFPDAQQPLQPGACRSRSVGERARAGAEVTCAAGEFAVIQGFRPGAFFALDGAPAAGTSDIRLGTVTIRRLFDLMQDDGPGDPWSGGPLEMRVSF